MPRNNDDIEQSRPPITPPEGDIEEQELFEPVSMPAPIPVPELEPAPQQFVAKQEQPEQESKSRWNWVGSPDRTEAQEESDGISDLFRVTAEDVGASDEDLSDLTDVDIERDILDADKDGSLDDLTEVTEADIMGDDDFGQRPAKPSSRQPRRRRIVPRYQPPTSMRRSG